ncbi:hypothetical protein [Bacillus atrophaeus]|uniref:hypothetical protein n=1 Tax=Bacillus atrophaeus TaxID=1452 RepID=UPI001C63A9AA|nr:hypothetical protein [Bacillus atrophaeus]MCY8489350.1 hypothetical protein [Bacillus atrophaeus]MCY8816760.1 hypothetical protein [Bacillus atrophaeus]MED4805816.1 hypothetical protein [Bacillus atrophaeus]MED4817598.1 hypothetical protein [Bacillus atrophaeus]MED4825763.1 hypothetical protein [Bacillus atrophaeus]
MSKRLKELGVKKFNCWTLQGSGFVFVTPQESKAEEVQNNLKEIREIALREYKEDLKGAGRLLTVVELSGKIISYK